MKILGLSFGRVMKNCDILTKKALMAAEAQGAQVQFINLMNKRIDHCKGCGACSAGMKHGKAIKCVIKDDYDEIEQAILDADGIIMAAPVYSLGVSGQFKNLLDRFSAAHDRAALRNENEKRKLEGSPLLDERYTKDRFAAYLSVGGASTPHWVSLGLPMMQLFGFSTKVQVVDQINAYDMGRCGNPLLNRALMQQVAALGEHVSEAVVHQDGTWRGGEDYQCPICHGSLLMVGATPVVTCPICGIHGTMTIEDNQVRVDFPLKEQLRARNTDCGLQEHFDEIKAMPGIAIPRLQAEKEYLDQEMKILAAYQR